MFNAFGSEVTMVEAADAARPRTRTWAGPGPLVHQARDQGPDRPHGDRDRPGGRGKTTQALQVTVADPDGQHPEQVETDMVLVGVGRRPTPGRWTSSAPGWRPTSGAGSRWTTGSGPTWPGVRHRRRDGKGAAGPRGQPSGLVAAGVMAGHDERMDYKAVPAATFTHPEVASVGLTEAAAQSAGRRVAVGRFASTSTLAQTFGSTEGAISGVRPQVRRGAGGPHHRPRASDLIPEGVKARGWRPP